MGGNFKVKCLETNGYCGYTKGKIYKIRDGKFTYDDFNIMVTRIDTIGDLDRNSGAIWELIEEEGENKVEDLRELLKIGYVVKREDESVCGIFQTEVNDLVLQDAMNCLNCRLNEYDEKLRKSYFDITEIYGLPKYKFDISIDNRPLIWKREEEPIKSPTQLEIESIELEQRKLADRLSKLKEGI